MSIPTTRLIPESGVTLLTTELNGLVNNGVAVSSVNGSSGVFDNSAGTASDGALFVDVHLTVPTLPGAPTAGYGISVWFLRSKDGGTTWEGHATGTTSSLPVNRPPDCSFNFNGQTSPYSPLCQPDIQAPTGKYMVLAWNNGSGVALASSGTILSIVPKAATQN